MSYQFSNKEFADAVARHRETLADVESVLDDLSLARASLESTLNSDCDPTVRARLMKDAAALAALVTKTTAQVVGLKHKMNQLLDKEALHRLNDEICRIVIEILREECPESLERIVDRLAPALSAAVNEATN